MEKRPSPHHICGILLFLTWFAIVVRGDFNLTLLHTNDVHARIEQTNKYSANCSEPDVAAGKCYGGVARRYAVIQEIRRNHSNVLLLDAGDEFQGTVWFSFYNGSEISHFMNRMGYDAMALGNHEFDTGVTGLLSPFMKNATFPIVACNINFSSSPEIQERVRRYITVNLTDGVVGIIGYSTPETALLADPKKIEDITFGDILPCVQESVKALRDQGINKIIALGHSGYSFSQEVAKIPGVDVVVDGHSHTLLYNGDPPSNEEVKGPYPTVVSQPDGGQALVLQAYAYGKYLGMAQISFDDAGKVKEWSGNPILLDNTWPQDPEILQEVETWRVSLVKFNQVKIGETYVLLEGGSPACRVGECNMGNMLTDAVLYEHIRPPTDSGWSNIRLVIWNGGGIRSSLQAGPITTGNLLEIHPFRNLIDIVSIYGSTLREILEYSVTALSPKEPAGKFLQVSGIKVTYDLSKPDGSRVVDVSVVCTDCDFPEYRQLEDNKTYSVLVNTYMINGGDGYSMLRDNIIHRLPLGTSPTDAMEHYIQKMSPVFPGTEDRITFKKMETDLDTAPDSEESAVTFISSGTLTTWPRISCMSCVLGLISHICICAFHVNNY